jgi:hypothetical protein
VALKDHRKVAPSERLLAIEERLATIIQEPPDTPFSDPGQAVSARTAR